MMLAVGCAKQGEYQYKYGYQYEYEAKKIPQSVLSGRVIGAQTQMTLRTKISFPGTTLASIETGEDGIFTTSVPSGTYLVKAEAEGFESQTLPVVLGEGESRTMEFVLFHHEPPKEMKDMKHMKMTMMKEMEMHRGECETPACH
jgi:hypothetical protein